MNRFLKIIFIAVFFSAFCVSDAKGIFKCGWMKKKIPAEIQNRIPEDIDYIGRFDGTGTSVRLLKKTIMKEVSRYYFLQGVEFLDLRNRYYFFGSTTQGYCGILVQGKKKSAKRLFNNLVIQLKKKAPDTVVSKNYAVSKKEQLLFHLFSDDLLLISIDDIKLARYQSQTPPPILKELNTSVLVSIYCKGDPRKIPGLRDYISGIPVIPGFKEVRMVLKLVNLTLYFDFVFPTAGEAEKTSQQMDNILDKVAARHPKFPSTFSKKLIKSTIHLALPRRFFKAAKTVLKDPEYQEVLHQHGF